MPSRHPRFFGVAGVRSLSGREKFASSIAELTDPLALEVLPGELRNIVFSIVCYNCCAAHINNVRPVGAWSHREVRSKGTPMLRHLPTRYAQRLVALSVAGILAVGVTASGCATPWFGTPSAPAAAPAASSGGDLKQATATYINSLCRMPKEQRDPKVRELNESLLPNHAAISCGRSGES